MAESTMPAPKSTQRPSGKQVCVWLKHDHLKAIRRLADEYYEGNFSMAARIVMQHGIKNYRFDDV